MEGNNDCSFFHITHVCMIVCLTDHCNWSYPKYKDIVGLTLHPLGLLVCSHHRDRSDRCDVWASVGRKACQCNTTDNCYWYVFTGNHIRNTRSIKQFCTWELMNNTVIFTPIRKHYLWPQKHMCWIMWGWNSLWYNDGLVLNPAQGQAFEVEITRR